MLREKAARIKLLFLDVDGVMTDGRIIMNDRGEETKCFDVKDGQGLKILLSSGIEVVIITGRNSKVVSHRAHELGIKEVYQGVKEKNGLCRQLIKGKGLNKADVCYMGDDLPDIAAFHECGLSIAVSDAAGEVCASADLITKKKGGRGAVREVCEWILTCQGKW
ncbi:MAG: phenylphosphate carboxylase subunit delta [Desulfobacteraceae bacterium 4484_190.1]|nr:MAG: phenylphosphate carboxylase subunit delta [Desulfobacteraceae bacterium 4484_190.1]